LADERPSGVAALPRRIERYGQARARALAVRDAIPERFTPTRATEHAVRARLGTCGDYLLFRHYLTQDEVRLHAAQFCRAHLLCPLCAIRRGAKALESYLARYEVIRQEKSALRPFLVTLTVKDGDDLDERFRHLRGSLQRLNKRASRGRGALAQAAGSVWSYEVKRGRGSGAWHPHVHMVVLAEQLPDQVDLSREWHEITGDSFIVDVRPISDDVASGFCEVFKYAVKFSDMEPADTLHAWRILRGRRLIASCGVFWGVEIPEELTDAPLDGPYVELLYRFVHGAGAYSFVGSESRSGGDGRAAGVPPAQGSAPTPKIDWPAYWRERRAAAGEVAEGCRLPPGSRRERGMVCAG
jgi:hypothetical protein